MLRGLTTENSALLNKEEKKEALSTIIYHNLSYYTPIAGQFGLGAVGLGAGFLYAGPATTCAQAASCGLWLSSLIGERAAISVFFAGGLDYAGINAYFSSVSVKNFIIFESRQTSWLKKLSWGSTILFYTCSQSISAFLSSSTTHAKTWQTALTVAGAVPGNLYSAVSTAQHEIPQLMSYLMRQCRLIQESLSALCFTPSAEEMLIRNKREFYQKQQTDFLTAMDRRWSYIRSYPRDKSVQAEDTPLSYLFSSFPDNPRDGVLRYTSKRAGQTVALGMSTAISIPFILNNFETINELVPSAAASGFLTAYFSYAFVYSNIKLCMNFVNGVLQILDYIVSGRPIDSLIYQLHPYITIGALALVLVASAMSYALMNTVYEMVFPQEGTTRDAFRYATNVSMVLYHIAGLYHLYELLLSKTSRNEQDKFLFRVEAEVERFHKMTLDEFRQFVETHSDDENQRLDIQTFRPVPASININDAERAEYQALQSSPRLFSASQAALHLTDNSAESRHDASPELKN